MAVQQANGMVHLSWWCILGVPMRGLSWYLQRLPWALDKTYLGSRHQALAEGRSNVLRGCTGYATNTMSGQEQEVGPFHSLKHINLRPHVADAVLWLSNVLHRLTWHTLRRYSMKWGPRAPWLQ